MPKCACCSFEKVDAEFLATFNKQTLKELTPSHEKLTSQITWMRDANKHFGEICDLEKHEDTAATSKILSVKWGLFTRFERLSGLELDRRELIIQIKENTKKQK